MTLRARLQTSYVGEVQWRLHMQQQNPLLLSPCMARLGVL